MARSFAVENTPYADFASRIIQAYGRRVGRGQVEDLAGLINLGAELDRATDEAVRGLRANDASWSQIGAQFGITRQAAMKRWGHVGGTRRRGGQPSELR